MSYIARDDRPADKAARYAEVEAEILAVLEKIRGSRTIVVIAHRLSSLARCDRVLMIEDGKLVADGSFQALLRDNPQFRRFANTGDEAVVPAGD